MIIATLPRVNLAHLPTPLEPVSRFGEAMGLPRLWMKRDDATGLATGGNKARKLEFILGQAVLDGVDTVLTTGGVQSNHARQTAAACAALGMDSILFLTGEPPACTAGNLFLDRLLGSEIRYLPADEDAEEAMELHARELEAEGRRPLVIALGGSVVLGNAGYALAVSEVRQQAIENRLFFDSIVLAGGSGGTAAGILAGLCAHQASAGLHVISVSRSAAELRDIILGHLAPLADLTGWNLDRAAERLHVYDEYVGAGYAIPTPECIQAVTLLARTEGILADTTYVGKALAGMMGLATKGVLPHDETTLFWHTGGVAGLFAVGEEIWGLEQEP